MKLGISASVAAVAGLGAMLFGAAPARAGGGIERGFDDGHGRSAAREVVRLGGKLALIGQRFGHTSRWAVYRAPGYARPVQAQHREPGPLDYAPMPLQPAHVHDHRVRGHVHPVRGHLHPASGHQHTAPPPVPRAASRPAQAYAAPPSHAEGCEHAASPHPYQERIIYERYERVINRAPPADRYDEYDRAARY